MLTKAEMRTRSGRLETGSGLAAFRKLVRIADGMFQVRWAEVKERKYSLTYGITDQCADLVRAYFVVSSSAKSVEEAAVESKAPATCG